MKQRCEAILRDKIQSLQQEYAGKLKTLQAEHQLALQQLAELEARKREALEAAYAEKLQALRREYLSKTITLEEEIRFLNERHDAQRLMMTDTLGYIEKLEEELRQLRATIGVSPAQ